MSSKDTFGLACAGGGAHGAYQVGILKYIHEHFCDGERSPFQVFTGCSCGSLNTSFFAAQSFDARQSRLWLEELWLDFHIPGYHGNMIKSALWLFLKEKTKPASQKSSTWSILDPGPMLDVIQKGFIRSNLDQALEKETTRGVGVVATELVSGRCCWFTEGAAAQSWNLFHSIGKIDRLGTPHVAASCSVPIFLPPVKVGNHYFLDGSIGLDRPLSAALAMGATKILSISTDKPHPDELPTYPSRFRPRLTNVIRMMLDRISYDPAVDEAIQIEAFNRFYKSLAGKWRKLEKDANPLPLFHEEHLPSHYRPIEVLQLHPSKRIRPASIESPYDNNSRERPRHTSFMFHKKFTSELIQLGYEDAKAQQEALKKFFRGTTPLKKFFSFFRRN